MEIESADYYDTVRRSEDFTLRVTDVEAGWRLDHFLVHHLPGFSRSQLNAAIKAGHILVNGCRAKVSKKLVSTDLVVGRVASKAELTAIPQRIDFQVLYEDECLLLLNKPPDLVVHPANGNPDNTLVNGLLFHCREIADVGDDSLRPGIVHRLDKDTSGIMVVAKREDVHRLLVEAFKQRQIKKSYKAIVAGHPQEKSGRIIAPIGRHPIHRKKMAVLPEKGKYAATGWHLNEHLQDGFSLIDLDLETGRTHQIRVHLASIGHPIAGDTLYGSRLTTAHFPRQMLHAASLEFVHPVTSNVIGRRAPLPDDMADALLKLGYTGELI